MSSISNFKNNFQGGVRPNQFRVYITAAVFGGADLEFLCKGTSIPSSVIGNIDVNYRGRILKVPGDRTYEDWTVTILNDPNWQNRSFFERWMDGIQDHTFPVRNVRSTAVYGTGTVRQLGRDGNTIATYVVEDIYPTNLAAMELDMSTNDTAQDFAVTFAVNNWRSSASNAINPSGTGVNVDFNVNASIGGVNIGFGT